MTEARLSSFELAYLLSGRSDERAYTARAILGLPPANDAATWEASGYASLDLRGLLGGEGEGILPHNWVGVIGYTIGTGAHWVALRTKDPVNDEFQLFVQGAGATLLVHRDAPNTWRFTGVTPGPSLAALARRVVTAYMDGAEYCDVMVRSVSPDVEDIRSVFARRNEQEWFLGADVVFPGDDAWPAPDLELASLSREAVLEAVAQKLAPHTVPIESP
jgi:hypothetical protein